MSTYVVVEFTVKDPEMYREKYAPIAGQTAKEHGGEVIAAGNWEVLQAMACSRQGQWCGLPTVRRPSGGTTRLSTAADRCPKCRNGCPFPLLDGLSLQTGRRQPQVSTRH